MTKQVNNDLFQGIFDAGKQSGSQNPYHRFGLLANPFPSSGQITPFLGMCVDQDHVKEAFRRNLREIIHDPTQASKRMMLIGTTGAGKTNILRYIAHQIDLQQQDQPESRVYSIYIQQPQGGYLEIHRQIVSQLARLFFTPLLEAIHSRRLNLEELRPELSGISPELLRALNHVISPNGRQLQLFDYVSPTAVRVLENWLQGAKLSAQEKNELGKVSVEIGSSTTVAVKYLVDLIHIIQYAGLCETLVILFDEFEQIVSGATSTNLAKYTQDLRNLLDSLDKGVFVIVGTAPIREELDKTSPALARRLSDQVEIEKISSQELALQYASAYLMTGRLQFRDSRIVAPQELDEEISANQYYPFSHGDIIEIYTRLVDYVGGAIVPGDLLPVLHRKLHDIAYSHTT